VADGKGGDVTSPEPLSFDAFCEILADVFKVDVSRVTAESYFITDLGADSLRILQAWVRLEKMGVRLSFKLAGQIQTVGDAYRCYQEQVAAGGK
jgi:acyl carrier protein